MTELGFSPVRYHLVAEILADPNGEWTSRELTDRVAAKVPVPAGAVTDSLYLMMAETMLEAVPHTRVLTFRLRTGPGYKLPAQSDAAAYLAALFDQWREVARIVEHVTGRDIGGSGQ